MKYDLFTKLAKIAIIIFIVVAVFRGNMRSITDFFNNIFVQNIQEKKTEPLKTQDSTQKATSEKKII